MSLKERIVRAGELLDEFYAGPYRQTLARARRDEDDLVRALVLGQALGVPDPAQFYTLELVPLMYAELGEWQQRLARPTSPFDHTRCCC